MLTLSHASHAPPNWSIAIQRSRLPTRSSSSLMCKSLHFHNIRPLDLHPLQRQPQHFNFDLAREGLDFSVWEIEVTSGLSRSYYEYMRQMVEDGLNAQVVADMVSKDASATKQQGPLFNRATGTTSVDLTTDQQETRIKVVAVYDQDVEYNAPAECKLFFSYPVGKDPTIAFSLLRRKNKRLLTLSKTFPVVDALWGISAIAGALEASSPASNDTVE
jgi:hypothetical protein